MPSYQTKIYNALEQWMFRHLPHYEEDNSFPVSLAGYLFMKVNQNNILSYHMGEPNM